MNLEQQTAKLVKRHMQRHGSDVRGGLEAVLRANPNLAKHFGLEHLLTKGKGTMDYGEEIDSRVRACMRSEGVSNYSEAMTRVLDSEPELAKRYGDGPSRDELDIEAEKLDRQSAGADLDKQARRMMAQDPKRWPTYAAALAEALARDPVRGAQYAGTSEGGNR